VFASGWTLEAAEAVGGNDELDSFDVIDLQASLVEKSLIVMEADSDRYRMLDTVKHYAQERAEESGEAGAARDRHLAYFLGFAETARRQLGGPEQGRWLAQMDAERENILAASAWCDSAVDGAESGLRLSAATKAYWPLRGQPTVGLRLTTEALARPGAEGRDDRRQRALIDAGQLCFFMGRYDEAQQHLTEALDITRQSGEPVRLTVVLQALGMTLLGRGQIEEAGHYLHEAAEKAEVIGKPQQRAAALNSLAQFHRMDRRFDEARQLFERVLALSRDAGDHNSGAIALLNLAMVAIEQSDLAQARRHVAQALEVERQVGSTIAAQSVLEVCAVLAARADEWAAARRFYACAEAQAQASGLHRDPADQAFLEPYVARLTEDNGRKPDASLDDTMAAARQWLAAAADLTPR